MQRAGLTVTTAEATLFDVLVSAGVPLTETEALVEPAATARAATTMWALPPGPRIPILQITCCSLRRISQVPCDVVADSTWRRESCRRSIATTRPTNHEPAS